ncbi:helix-turn-helix domain-containing protein [Shewanella abyssi]|uniref:helix-turn-helix domain-containing protein n=1 Tax=Shewanella abyssi TaxID=311789 RepID=UPI00200CC435|nr:helix-turn-helix domain-containing protein [Shewanella abyssi]MCL1048195.1 helix-turn-helix domain-containing protein [Shewanella abyssi]
MDNYCYDNLALSQLIRKEKSAKMRLKLLAVLHFQDGKSRYQIASYLKVSRTSVNRWISNYLSHGLHGLEEKKHPGRPSGLSESQQVQLTNYIDNITENSKLDKFKGTDIQNYIDREFGIKYEISNIYKILARLGYNSPSNY